MRRDSQLNSMNRRTGERGAALVTMLMMSLLLLAAGGALVMTTTMSSSNAMDSTTEMQAYYVAEAGMQSALNVLRGSAQPLVVATDRMSFRAATIPDVSNGPGNNGPLRLAGWLPYNTRTDPGSLVPINIGAVVGGYRVTVENLDPNSNIVTYQTSGVIEGSGAGTPNQRTFGTVGGTDEVTIRYDGQAPTTVTPDPHVYPLTVNSGFGSFVIERPVTSTQNGVVIPRTTFELTVTQTSPWAATTTFEASLQGTIDVAATTLTVTFTRPSLRADGTTYALNSGGADPKVLNLTYPLSPATTQLQVNVTAPDPKRLLLRSFGFGPRGSEKRLEMILTRANLDFEAPAGVTIQGADDCTPLNLDTGSSGAKWYSGIDYSGVDPQRPTFAVTSCDQDDAVAGIKKPGTVVDPEIGVLANNSVAADTVERPSFLDTADKARAYLNALQAKAQSVNRYFKQTSGALTVSDPLDAPTFTFVDGDCTLMDGAGFLVVTGTLTMRGNTNFKGAILVLGQGVLIRNGGGNGEILGGITIARFDRTAGGFLSPTFSTNGGGNSNVQYDSQSVLRAIGSAMNVAGVREF